MVLPMMLRGVPERPPKAAAAVCSVTYLCWNLTSLTVEVDPEDRQKIGSLLCHGSLQCVIAPVLMYRQ